MVKTLYPICNIYVHKNVHQIKCHCVGFVFLWRAHILVRLIRAMIVAMCVPMHTFLLRKNHTRHRAEDDAGWRFRGDEKDED